jgi:hypothetical protein
MLRLAKADGIQRMQSRVHHFQISSEFYTIPDVLNNVENENHLRLTWIAPGLLLVLTADQEKN